MKQTIPSMLTQPNTSANKQDILIYESNRQYSAIVAMNRESGGLSFLVLSKEAGMKSIR